MKQEPEFINYNARYGAQSGLSCHGVANIKAGKCIQYSPPTVVRRKKFRTHMPSTPDHDSPMESQQGAGSSFKLECRKELIPIPKGHSSNINITIQTAPIYNLASPSFSTSHVNMAQVQPADPPQTMTSMDYIHLCHMYMKKVPKLGLFSDYSEMEAELREKIAKGTSNVDVEQPQSSVSEPRTRRTKKEKISAFNTDTPADSTSGGAVAGPSRQPHCEDLDEVMRGDNEFVPTYTQSFSPPASNTRWKGKRRAVEGGASNPTLCATQGSITRHRGSGSPPRESTSRTKRRKIEIEESNNLPTSSIAAVTISDATQDEIEQESDFYTVLIDRKGKKIRQCNTHPEIRTDSKGDMDRHLECLDHQGHSYHCVPECGKSFTRRDALVRHIKKEHQRQVGLDRGVRSAVWRATGRDTLD